MATLRELDFHIPNHILANIVSFVAEDGATALKDWIISGNEGKDAALSPESLNRVRLESSPNFVAWSLPNSSNYPFFCKCLKEKNTYAIYAESLRLGFNTGDLNTSIRMLSHIKDKYPQAKLMLILLSSYSGVECCDLYHSFHREHVCLAKLEEMADMLIYHVNNVQPRRRDSYGASATFAFFPECWLESEFIESHNGKVCIHCIYYYLAQDVRLLS